MSKGTVNKAILIGRLGGDPETRFTGGGGQVTNFSIATNEVYKGETKTEWHSITCFGKTAENTATWLKKGSQVYIEGRIQCNKWEKDGVKHNKTVIMALSVQFMGGTKSEGQNNNQQQGNNQNQQVDDENLPF